MAMSKKSEKKVERNPGFVGAVATEATSVQPTTVGGTMDLKKVNEQHLRAFMRQSNVFLLKTTAEAKDTGVKELVSALSSHYEQTLKEDDAGECENCLGICPMDLERCPFCGHSEADNVPPAHPVPVPAAEPEPVKSTSLTVVKGGKGKATKGAKTEAKPDDKAIVVAPSSDLKSSSSILTERELDEAVADVSKLKGMAAASAWALGRRIKDIYDNLWQLRRGDDGKPRYKGFEAFVVTELQMSPTNARNLMDVAAHYTEAQVIAFGTRKLKLILEAPDEDQPALLEKAGDLSKRELEEQVRQIKKEKGHVRPGRDGVVREGAGEKGGRKPREEKVTIASFTPRMIVKAFAKPASIRNLTEESFAKMKRAKKISDTPWGVADYENGVQLMIELRDKGTGDLEFVVHLRKVDE